MLFSRLHTCCVYTDAYTWACHGRQGSAPSSGSRGRFYARLSVPAELRDTLGKRELLKALGGDRQVALRALPEVIAGFNRQIESARAGLLNERSTTPVREQAAPLTVEEISAQHYADRLEIDAKLRDLTPIYARIGVDDGYLADVKAIAIGAASNDLIKEIFGREIERICRKGCYSCSEGGTDWRRLARHLAHAELEVIKRMFERDEAELVTTHPQWVLDHLPRPNVQSQETAAADIEPRETSLRELFRLYRRAMTGGVDDDRTTRSYTPKIENLIEFLGADDATLITNRKLSDWVTHLRAKRDSSPRQSMADT